jgi:hypothetical protein
MADVQNSEQNEFLIQTRLDPGGGPQLEGRHADAVIKGTQEKLDAAAAVARKTGIALHKVFDELRPDTGAVEFSLAFEGKGGIPMLAAGGAEASITVTLEWNGGAKQ